jgi:hypothetical protein
MGAAPAREAESIVYRRKSFRKKNSSPAIEELRGSAVGVTTNDAIAPATQFLKFVYNMYGTLTIPDLWMARAVPRQPEDTLTRGRERA